MIASILTGLAVMASWVLGLSFVRMKPGATIFNAVIAGVLAFLLSWLMLSAQLAAYLPAALLVLFLLVTAVVQLQKTGGYHTSVLSLFLAEGTLAAFTPLCQMARLIPQSVSVCLIFALVFCGFWVVFWILHLRFPDMDWQEFFSATSPDSNRLNIRLGHIYAVAAVPCLCNTLMLIPVCGTLPQAAIISFVAFVLLWFSVLMIIVMTSYKKERLSVLLEQQYRSEMNAFMNVIRSQRHDYNFHVQVIAGLIAGGKIEECRTYVQALEKDSVEMNEVMPIKDPAIAATINSFRSLAIRENIVLHIDIHNDLSLIATNVYETNKIISNLLQNAIDEVSTHQDKSFGIRLCILKRREYCVIRVSNKITHLPAAEHLGMLYQQGYTTKTGHEGIGLSSIRLLAQRYRGIVFAQTEGDIIHFTARIPIDIKKKKNEESAYGSEKAANSAD